MPAADVSISLIGSFALRVDGVRQPLGLSGNTKRLLMLLASCANRSLRRERIADEIWPDSSPERAASSLNTGISRVRKSLVGYIGLKVECVDDVVSLRVMLPAKTDTWVLERALETVPTAADHRVGLDPATREHLQAVTSAVRGRFLEGCEDHWVLPLREHYGALLIQALTVLMRDTALCGDFERALAFGRRILEIDPFREATQREVMGLYVLNGQRAQAIRQYRALEGELRAELQIAPMPETTALVEAIRRADFSAHHILPVWQNIASPAA